MSISRTGLRTAPGGLVEQPITREYRNGFKLEQRYSAVSAYLEQPRLLSFSSTIASAASTTAPVFNSSSTTTSSADRIIVSPFSGTRSTDLLLIAARVSQFANLTYDNATPLPFSGTQVPGGRFFAFTATADSDHVPRSRTLTRSGGDARITYMGVTLRGVALDRSPISNYSFATNESNSGQISWPEFEVVGRNSLLAYIGFMANANAGAPYFTTWQYQNIELASGTSYPNGYERGSASDYGAVAINLFRRTGGEPGFVPPVQCNISTLTTTMAAIVELPRGVAAR
jgi:hypothetical protein